jgi:hypothetical protein
MEHATVPPWFFTLRQGTRPCPTKVRGTVALRIPCGCVFYGRWKTKKSQPPNQPRSRMIAANSVLVQNQAIQVRCVGIIVIEDDPITAGSER